MLKIASLIQGVLFLHNNMKLFTVEFSMRYQVIIVAPPAIILPSLSRCGLPMKILGSNGVKYIGLE